MTFQLKDFKVGDIIRDDEGDVGEVVTISRRCLYVLYANKEHWPYADWSTARVLRVSPLRIVEIEQVMVGERAIGV